MKKNRILFVSSLILLIGQLCQLALNIGYQMIYFKASFVGAIFSEFFNEFIDSITLDIPMLGKIMFLIMGLGYFFFSFTGIMGLVLNGKNNGSTLLVVLGVFNIIYVVVVVISFSSIYQWFVDGTYILLHIPYIIYFLASVGYLIGAIENKNPNRNAN